MQQNPDITTQEYGNLIEQNARTMRGLQGQFGQIGRQPGGASQIPAHGAIHQGVEPLQGGLSSQAGYGSEIPVDEAETVGVRRFPSRFGQHVPVAPTHWNPATGTPPAQQSPHQVPNGFTTPGIQQQGVPSQQPTQQLAQQQIPLGQIPSAQRSQSFGPVATGWQTAQGLQQNPHSVGAQATGPQATGPGVQQQAGPGQSLGAGSSPFQGTQHGHGEQFRTAGSMAQGGGPTVQQSQGFTTRQPTVNLLDEEDHFVLEADMPGVKKKDLDVTIYGNTVTIEAQVETSKGAGALLVGERAPSFLYRRIQLPAEVDADKVDATLADGVLIVEMPKREPGKGLHRIKL